MYYKLIFKIVGLLQHVYYQYNLVYFLIILRSCLFTHCAYKKARISYLDNCLKYLNYSQNHELLRRFFFIEFALKYVCV